MGELEAKLNAMFDLMAAKNSEEIVKTIGADAQGVDEISRKWMRGETELADYIRNVLTQVEDVSTTVKDAHESIAGDVGVLTCWIDQDYTFQGQEAHVSAPTTVLYRREGGDWKMSLFHSIPLPEES